MAASLREHGQDLDISPVFATPQLAVQAEACIGNFGSLPPLDETIASMVTVLHLLCRSLEFGHLKEVKSSIVGVLGVVLEGADSAVALAVALDYLCRWTDPHGFTPLSGPKQIIVGLLSRKEQLTLLGKLGSLDRLPESSAQPLLVRMSILAGRLLELRKCTDGYANDNKASGQNEQTSVVGAGLELVGLLSLQEDVRELCYNRLSSSWDLSVKTEVNESTTIAAKFRAVLNSDLCALLGRHWGLLIFPTVFMSCVDVSKDIYISNFSDSDGRIGHVQIGVDCDTSLTADHHCTDLITYSTKSFVKSLEHLSLSSVHVGRTIVKNCLQQLWSSLTSDDRTSMTLSLSKNITRFHHRQILSWPSELTSKAFDSHPSSLYFHSSEDFPLNVPQVTY